MNVRENIQEVAKLSDRVAEGINKRNRGVQTVRNIVPVNINL